MHPRNAHMLHSKQKELAACAAVILSLSNMQTSVRDKHRETLEELRVAKEELRRIKVKLAFHKSRLTLATRHQYQPRAKVCARCERQFTPSMSHHGKKCFACKKRLQREKKKKKSRLH
jgi:hypothetical protein